MMKLNHAGGLLALAGMLAWGEQGKAADVRTVTFQNGLAEYTGLEQFRMTASGVVQPGFEVEQYFLDGNPFTNPQDDTFDILIFRDLIGSGAAQIPAGARILDATLTITTGIGSNAQSAGPWMVGRLTEDVGVATSTYETWPLDPPALRSVRSVTALPWLAGAGDVALGEVVQMDVTAAVAAWVQGATNSGLAIFTNDTTDGWQVSTTGSLDATRAPKLTVVYTVDAPTVTDYIADRSALVRSAVPTVDGSTLTAAFLDFATDDVIEGLIRFDLLGDETGRIGSQDEVLSAKLVVRTGSAPEFSGAADSNDPITVHRVLKDWTVESTFGLQGISETTGEITPAVDEVTGAGEASEVWFDVTQAVKAWQAGQANFGLNLKVQGTDGWQMLWPGTPDGALVPKLRVWSVRGTGIPLAQIAPGTFEGRAPLTVSLDASGSSDPQGQALSYAWDFADGSTNSGAQVTHVFTQPGLYDVVLKVRDTDGKEGQAVVRVRALGAPSAQFSADRVSGVQPLPVRLDARASADPDGGTVTFDWNFGDGETATGAIVDHVFRSGGRFVITLTVTDDEGDRSTFSREVQVAGNSVQAAIFQQGLNGYSGTSQMRVRADGLVEFGQNFQQYYVDGRPQDPVQAANDTCDLIRFDGLVGTGAGQIPANATVVKAMLTYWTGSDGDAVSDGPWVIGFLKTGFDTNTTYDLLDSGTGLPEERGPRGSVDPRVLSGFADITAEEIVSADVTDYVQRWVNGETNHGMAIFSDDTANGWQLRTIGNANVGQRPKLSVFYTTGSVVRREFPVTRSAVVYKGAPLLDGTLAGPLFLDGEPPVADFKAGLFLFDDLFGNGAGQVPAGHRILSASFITETGGVPDSSGNSDSDDPFFVHEMLSDWDLSTDFGADGVDLGTQVGTAVSEFIGMGERARAFADVTAVVASWAAGGTNRGFYVHPGGADGWLIYWPSPGLIPEGLEPRLLVLSEVDVAPPQPLQFQDARWIEGGLFQLVWDSVAGARYAIEASPTLGGWSTAVPEVTSQGATTTHAFIPVEPVGGAQFFRLRLLP